MTRILVYSNGDTFGDALLKIPAIAALRHTFPEAHITWLAGRGHTLYADRLHYPVQPFLDAIVDNADVGARWRELLRRPLNGQYFDIVIDTQQFLKTTLILKRIRHGLFVSAAAGYRLSDCKPDDARTHGRHMLDRLLTLIGLAAGHPVEPVYGIRLPDEYRGAALRLLPNGACYVGLAPGAGQPWKCWPLERFIAVGRYAVEYGCVPVFFLGPQEQEWRERISQALPTARFPEWEDLGDLHRGPLLAIALAERLTVSVANDSGTGHMLAAGQNPLLSLFGPSSPEKFAPNSPAVTLIRAQDYGTNNKMETIPVDAVTTQLTRFIERR